jgi:hypothetical protein
MDVQAYGRMGPLYEAMTVCSSTIEWFELQEKHREAWDLQSNLSDLVRAIEKFVATTSERDLLAGASREVVTFSILCVEAVNSMVPVIAKQTRDNIAQLSERFREPVTALLDQIESLCERVDAILEAWKIVLDDELSGKLKSAVEHIDRSQSDISDWRQALEAIHN